MTEENKSGEDKMSSASAKTVPGLAMTPDQIKAKYEQIERETIQASLSNTGTEYVETIKAVFDATGKEDLALRDVAAFIGSVRKDEGETGDAVDPKKISTSVRNFLQNNAVGKATFETWKSGKSLMIKKKTDI